MKKKHLAALALVVAALGTSSAYATPAAANLTVTLNQSITEACVYSNQSSTPLIDMQKNQTFEGLATTLTCNADRTAIPISASTLNGGMKHGTIATAAVIPYTVNVNWDQPGTGTYTNLITGKTNGTANGAIGRPATFNVTANAAGKMQINVGFDGTARPIAGTYRDIVTVVVG